MGELNIGKSAAPFARATKVLPGGNSRTTVWSSPHPVYAASGEGCWLTDVDGNRYLIEDWRALPQHTREILGL